VTETVVVAAPVTEEVADATTEAVEAASDAAVDIAEIQADRDVEIAEIQADANVTIAETETTEDDLLWLRDQLAGLQVSQDLLASKMETIVMSLSSLALTVASLLILIPPSPPVVTEAELIPVLTPEAESPENVVVAEAVQEVPRPARRWM
jgi:hypothetical protein